MWGKVPEQRQTELWTLHRVPLSTQQGSDLHRHTGKLPKAGKEPPKRITGNGAQSTHSACSHQSD